MSRGGRTSRRTTAKASARGATKTTSAGRGAQGVARGPRYARAVVKRSREPFWRLYRVIPLALVLLVIIASIVVESLPTAAAQRLLAPVLYPDQVIESSERHGVDPYLVCAVIRCESDWDPAARSVVGARGLMQLMPSTAEEIAQMGLVDGSRYPSDDLANPATNIEYGCAYLSYLSQRLGTVDEVVAAYNAGIGKVTSWQVEAEREGVSFREAIVYPETQIYVERVGSALQEYHRCYPEGISVMQ